LLQSVFCFCLKAGVPKSKRHLVSKLAECGWLFNKVKNYVENKSADKTFGLVGQVGLYVVPTLIYNLSMYYLVSF